MFLDICDNRDLNFGELYSSCGSFRVLSHLRAYGRTFQANGPKNRCSDSPLDNDGLFGGNLVDGKRVDPRKVTRVYSCRYSRKGRTQRGRQTKVAGIGRLEISVARSCTHRQRGRLRSSRARHRRAAHLQNSGTGSRTCRTCISLPRNRTTGTGIANS